MATMTTVRQRWLHELLVLWVCTSAAGFVVPSASLKQKLVNSPTFTSTKLASVRDDSEGDHGMESESRRKLLLSLPFVSFLGAAPAEATLVQFPCKDSLMNTYHFMRAGESLLEEENILSTNPLFLTNREAALSPRGEEQVHQACRYMEQYGLNPSVVKFSLAANAMDTADIVSMDLQVGRNRLVPEYTYMDQRGVGRWDMLPLQSTQEAVWAMDAKEAGKEGLGGRPPAHEDGTPNETLSNQVTRLRQLISLLETSLSGDDILLIFPDGTGPAVLSCLIAGIPLDRVHELNFQPGEVRLDVKYDSVLAMLPVTPTPEYQETIARGMDELKALRAQNPQEILNVKEQIYEAEVAAEKKREKALSLKREEKERALRVQKEQQEAARVQNAEAFATSDNEVSFSNLLSVGGLGLAASMVAFRSYKSEDADEILAKMEKDETTSVPDVTFGQTVPSKSTPSLEKLDAMDDLMQKQPIFNATETGSELKAMEQLIERAPIEIPEFASIEEERKEVAARAMQEYMDQDDGGDAWLGVMSDIMAEDD